MPAQTLETGKPLDRIACKNDPNQSYALYLPDQYTPDKKWPVLYIFDPGGRAASALELFIPAAKKYGFILVCSWNAKNGPSQIIHQAIWAIWNDTRERFSIDPRRICAAGFSGGARIASLMHVLTNKSCAGIIACGAGLSLSIQDLPSISPVYYYGLVGLKDFNYNEMNVLAKNLDKNKMPNHLHILDMEHRWPAPEILTSALEWLETDAIKKNFRPTDPELIQSVLDQARQRAGNYELSGNFYFAARICRAAAKHLDGLTDISTLLKKAESLESKPEHRRFFESEQRRITKEHEFRADIHRAFQFAQNAPDAPADPDRILEAIHIKTLLKQEQKKDDYYETCMARRILTQLWMDASAKGGEYYNQKKWPQAALFFEISAATGQQPERAYYNLACVCAMNQKKKDALKYLELAIKNGFTNKKHIEADLDLELIRSEERYKKLLLTLPELP